MRKARVVFLSSDKQRVIDTLHELEIIDFRRSELDLSEDQPLEHADELSELIVRFEGAIKLLPKSNVTEEKKLPLGSLLKTAKSMKVIDEIFALDEERKALKDEQLLLKEAHSIAGSFSCLDVDFSKLKSGALDFVGFETDSSTLAKIEDLLISRKIASKAESCKVKDRVFVLIAYQKNYDVRDIVKKLQVRELDMKSKYLDGKPAEVTKKTGRELEKNSKSLLDTEKKLVEMGKKEYSRLINILAMLRIELDRSNASSMFKKTEKTCILEGWVRAKRMEEFHSAITKVTKGACQIEDVKDEEIAPTMMNRPNALKPFDYMMEFFSVPRSDEIDPTWIFIISFPIFYGFMVSDVGYGIMSFILSAWVVRVTKPNGLVWNAGKIWRIGAVSAVVFGVITNQYFGLALNNYFLPFTGFDWIKNVAFFALVSVIFGLSQVVLGLTFGFINSLRHHERKLAFSKITAIFMLLFGTVFVAGAFFHAVSGTLTEETGIIALAALISTAVLMGIEAVEVTTLMTHPLSYLRLMGFGLASVILAALIDKAFTPTLHNGIIMFVIYIILFFILHTLNMILSIFEGIVQAIRLNFVEFYTKFYKGRGTKFRPFGYKKMLNE